MKTLARACIAMAALYIGMHGSFAQTRTAPGRIGVLSDMSTLYSAIGGKGSLLAARMAAEDFGGKVIGVPIEIVSGDHQNKVDVASALARRWVDSEGVSAFADVATSSTALAVQVLERQRQRAVVLISGGGARPLADEECSPVGFLWNWNTWSVATSTAKAMVQRGAKNWYFLTADYAFGHAL